MASREDNPKSESDKDPGSNKRPIEEVEEEDVLTMLDVLESEESLENDAKAVLGNSDMDSCSYLTGGYVKRQALYACISCCVPDSPDFQPAALCLGCSEHCHSGHEIVELYTKRNTRCDCGNKKFKNNPCKLEPKKIDLNSGNKYNQNYKGLYCTCHRPYPDPEVDTAQQSGNEAGFDMIQCIICEDWYHCHHLEGAENAPKSDSFGEMICHICVNNHAKFLNAYVGLSITNVKKDDLENSVADAQSELEVSVDNNTSLLSEENKDSNVEQEKTKTNCYLKSSTSETYEKLPALFMPDGWRDQLCKCVDCKTIYAECDTEFLLDPEDTVQAYESQALSNGSSGSYEEGMRALSQMDRVQQVEAIQGYNDMKTSLKDFLKKFADEGKVVTEEDIKEFFSNMKSAKRQRIEIPGNCR